MLEYDALLTVMKEKNWEQVLEGLGVASTWDGDYVSLSYKFLSCDFNNPVVRACRGVILKREETGFRIVCAPFIKFSYGTEDWERPIDWSTAKVRDKIDGSLMKAYYDDGWKLATNSTVNAFTANLGDERVAHTFGELFEYIIKMKFENWAENFLDKDFTYMFEMTSPYNRVVIPYKDSTIWYLSRRNMQTLLEDDSDVPGLIRPKLYTLDNLKDVLDVVNSMVDEEGVVVYDGNFNRVKIKSKDYLEKHYLSHNNVVTFNRVIEMIKEESIDDYLAYFEDPSGYIQSILTKFKNKLDNLDNTWYNLCTAEVNKLSAKAFATAIKEYPNTDYLFYKYHGGDFNAREYVLSKSTKYIEKLLGGV